MLRKGSRRRAGVCQGEGPRRAIYGNFWSPAELLEVDGALLDERVPALHRLLGLVVEVEGGVGELRHPGTLLGVDVERLLGEGESRRALVEELPAPLLDLGPEVEQW